VNRTVFTSCSIGSWLNGRGEGLVLGWCYLHALLSTTQTCSVLVFCQQLRLDLFLYDAGTCPRQRQWARAFHGDSGQGHTFPTESAGAAAATAPATGPTGRPRWDLSGCIVHCARVESVTAQVLGCITSVCLLVPRTLSVAV
jgi:hypothetical protein